MKKYYYIVILVLLTTLFLVACNGKNKDGTKDVEDGLIINSISIGLGGEPNQTEVNYSLNLWNKTKNSITIISVKPILNQNIQELLITEEITNKINKVVVGNSAEIIKGSFIINTKGYLKPTRR
jgi:hypothetical protein